MINMLLLNIPLVFCWIMLTGGWKKFGTYNCADKFAKLILVLCALVFSGVTVFMLIVVMIKFWAASGSVEMENF